MNILAIGAHPDDIEYGCGGALMQMKEQGHKIFIMVMTEGSEGGNFKKRIEEQEEAIKMLRAEELIWGNEIDTQIEVSNVLINKIGDVIKKCNAELILFNHPEDTHQDHRAISMCANTASRYMKKVLTFEVPTSIDFQPDIFIDIGGVIEKKDQLLKIHESQMDKTKIPHLMITENALACAVFRGFQGRVKYAEGFRSIRYMIDNF